MISLHTVVKGLEWFLGEHVPKTFKVMKMRRNGFHIQFLRFYLAKYCRTNNKTQSKEAEA